MKIAFISYEYPPDTALGGISTYVHHAARMLKRCGHYVEVFCGSLEREGAQFENDILVHRVRLSAAEEMRSFGVRVAPVFAERHGAVNGFDVLESPELNAEACESLALVTEIPLVIKLHTPTYLIARYTAPEMNASQKLRFALGALRQGCRPRFPKNEDLSKRNEFERRFAHCADEIVAPSVAIGNMVREDWDLPHDRLAVVPLPFEPQQNLLSLRPESDTMRVLYMGRLEPRKGVQHLAVAVPEILRAYPKAKFRFVGQVLHSPQQGRSMDEFIRSKVGPNNLSSLEFVGQVFPRQIAKHLAVSTICVFPSVWESFGYVCLEALSSGRAVVGSSSGGMSEIMDRGRAGLLVPPQNPKELAHAVIRLFNEPQLRYSLGIAGRKRVLETYSYNAIVPLQMASYQRAIARRKSVGPRSPTQIPLRPVA